MPSRLARFTYALAMFLCAGFFAYAYLSATPTQVEAAGPANVITCILLFAASLWGGLAALALPWVVPDAS